MLAAGLLAGPSAAADGLLDPTRIACRYTLAAGVGPRWLGAAAGRESARPGAEAPAAWSGRALGPSELWISAAPAPLAARDDAERPPEVFAEATRFTAQGIGLTGNLARLRERVLPVAVGAHSVTTAGDALFSGLDDIDGRGRTFRAQQGRVLGDLSVSVGAGATRAGLGEWWVGVATIEDLNPFRDLSAQLDIAVLTDVSAGAPLVVIRIRATYLGAFSGAGGAGATTWGEEGASEVGLSLGLKF